MKNMSNKTKKLIVTGSLAIVCVVLIAAIYFRFQTEPVKDDGTPPSVTMSSDVTPTPDITKSDETAEKKDDIVVKPVEPTPLPSETPTQDANEIVQSNVPEAEKPEPPEKPTPQGDETNPAKPPEYKPEDTTISEPAEPKGGEKKDGKVYLPGFGWVPETGGSGTTVDGEGDINKQVGTMD